MRVSPVIQEAVFGAWVLAVLTAFAVMVFGGGCAYTKIRSDNNGGFSATRVSFLVDFNARGFRISQTATGQPIVEWSALDQDQTKGAAAVARGAVEGIK